MSKSQQTEALLNKISEIANEYKKLTQELSTESIVSDHKNDIGTDITPNYPGTIKFHANSEEKVDYRLGGSFYNKNSLPTRQDYR